MRRVTVDKITHPVVRPPPYSPSFPYSSNHHACKSSSHLPHLGSGSGWCVCAERDQRARYVHPQLLNHRRGAQHLRLLVRCPHRSRCLSVSDPAFLTAPTSLVSAPVKPSRLQLPAAWVPTAQPRTRRPLLNFKRHSAPTVPVSRQIFFVTLFG